MLKWKLKKATTVEDLEKIEELGEEVHFQIGLRNRQLIQQKTENHSYLILNEEDGVAVGFRTIHILSPTLVYKHQAFLDKKYRRQGTFFEVANHIDRDLVHNHGVDYDRGQDFYNNNDISLMALRKVPGIVFGPKLLVYLGNLTKDQVNKIQPNMATDIYIKLVESGADLDLLKAYDHKIHPVSRDKYLDAWLSPNNDQTTTALAVNAAGDCVGYANLSRVDERFYFTAPAYADKPEICVGLFKWLWERVPSSEFFSGVYFPSEQRTVLSLVHGLGWREQDKSEVRCYSKSAIPLPWEKIFCLHEYFLC